MRLLLSAAALVAALVAMLAGCTPANLRDAPEAGMAETGMNAAPAYAPNLGPAAPAAGPSTEAIPSSDINQALFGTPDGPATGPATGPAGAAPAANLPPPSLPPAATQPLPVVQPGAGAVQGAADPAQTGAAPAGEGNALGISDTQDFQAVSSRESIESNKARIEADKASYQQIQPTALPARDASTKVSAVVAYALAATNRLGERIYDRPAVSPEKHQAACMAFTSEEAAQEAFLKAGGPKRDPKKLDPDGDGFACKFDPTPFQQARG